MFDYKIIRSQRRTLGIIVSPESGVIIRAPYRCSAEEIRRFVESRSEWIEKHISRFSALKKIGISCYSGGSLIMYRGKEYSLSVIPSRINSIELKKGTVELKTSEPDNEVVIRCLIERWYRQNAEIIFRNKLKEVLAKYPEKNFRPVKFSVRKMRRKWGSCSTGGKITINSELIKLDDSLLEYVVIHELCHLIHHNHSREFYNLLSQMMPEWKVQKSRLKGYIS